MGHDLRDDKAQTPGTKSETGITPLCAIRRVLVGRGGDTSTILIFTSVARSALRTTSLRSVTLTYSPAVATTTESSGTVLTSCFAHHGFEPHDEYQQNDGARQLGE